MEFGKSRLGDDQAIWDFAKLESHEIDSFTEATFQKVIHLKKNESYSRFVIAAILARRGAFSDAVEQMRALAPKDRRGFELAHIWLAQFLLVTDAEKNSEELAHHLQIAKASKFVPPSILALASQWELHRGNSAEAMKLLSRAAELAPEYQSELFRLAVAQENQLVAETSSSIGITRIKRLVRDGKASTAERILLASMQLYRGDDQDALATLQGALNQEELAEPDTKLVMRALSETYRTMFNRSLQVVEGKVQSDLSLLNNAFRADPQNPLVAQTVAKLARIGGERPPQALIDQLQAYLAQGKATPITHAWIAEAFILREDYERAISHLSQVIGRIPNATQSRNNLAYALALQKRELDTALEHAQFAVNSQPDVAQFHDTYGFVLLQQGKNREAAEAFEQAIELQSTSAYHQHAAQAYAALGQNEQAEEHRAKALSE